MPRAASASNEMHGERVRPDPVRHAGDATKRGELLRLTQRHLETMGKTWLSTERALEPEACLNTLLKGRSPYGYPTTSAS